MKFVKIASANETKEVSNHNESLPQVETEEKVYLEPRPDLHNELFLFFPLKIGEYQKKKAVASVVRARTVFEPVRARTNICTGPYK